MRPSRRELVKLTSAGLAAAVHAGMAQALPPTGEISVRLTAADKRYAQEPALKWTRQSGFSAPAVVIEPGKTFQEILGFGASMTDAACYMFNRLAAPARDKLFHELFDPSENNFSVSRICIGSSDYATKVYSYDEGEPDPDMTRFSIDHDRQWNIPMLKASRAVNPDLFLLASPWSPPGWMKANKSMLGGCIQTKSFPWYAKYFVKFLQSYAEAGVPVNAVTVQNEVDAEQDGRMPACLFGQEHEIWFVSRHLGPALADNKLDTRIWILDHNYDLWGRVLDELSYPQVKRYVDGVAWHGYAGRPDAMTRVHAAHPEKHMYWTEGGPEYRQPDYATNWARWSRTFAGILRNWSRCIIGWNMALDEVGKPNIGPFYCGGMITINSKTLEVTRSGQYWAMVHYSRAIRRGAKRIESTGSIERVEHVAFENPDGSKVAVLTNSGREEKKVVLRVAGAEAEVTLPASSVVTLTWS